MAFFRTEMILIEKLGTVFTITGLGVRLIIHVFQRSVKSLHKE